MSILSNIIEKIKPAAKLEAPAPDTIPIDQPLPVENKDTKSGSLVQYENKKVELFDSILKEVILIKDAVIAKNKKQKAVATKKETVDEAVVREKKKAKRADGQKEKTVDVSKEAASERKRKDAERIRAEREKAAAPKEKKPIEKVGGTVGPEEKPVEEEDMLGGLVKLIFGGILAAGGIVVFMRTMFNSMLAQMFGVSEEDSMFAGLMMTIEEILAPVKLVYKIISPILEVLGTIVKEGLLSLDLSWKESKLELYTATWLAPVRMMLGIKVSDEEVKDLQKEVYEGRVRKEERMKGYVEKVTGKKPEGAAPVAAPPQVAAPAPTPTVQAPAPTPAVRAAPPPPAVGAPAPTPTAPAARPAGAPPPPAPGIKPTEPTLGPPKKPSSPSFQEGKKKMLEAMDKEGITDPVARAQILAQTAHESGSFKYTQELGNAQYFQKYEGRKDLGNVNPGDGLKYIGRGFLQTTGRVNYQQFKDAFGVDVIANPEKLAEPEYAAQSALFWFKKNAKKVANMSGNDWSNTKGVTKAVNGGYNGLDDRLKYFEMFKNDPDVIGKPSGGTMTAQAPATGEVLNKTSAEVGSEKADRSRQPNVNVTYVNNTKMSSVSKNVYG